MDCTLYQGYNSVTIKHIPLSLAKISGQSVLVASQCSMHPPIQTNNYPLWTSQRHLFGIWICYWLSNFIPVLLLVWSAWPGEIYLIFKPFHSFWLLNNNHVLCRYIPPLRLVAYFSSFWSQELYPCRILLLSLRKEAVIRLTPFWSQTIF